MYYICAYTYVSIGDTGSHTSIIKATCLRIKVLCILQQLTLK